MTQIFLSHRTTDPSQVIRDLIGSPFEWVDIPAGKVTLEEGGYVKEGGETFDVVPFSIAKYCITNAQFDVFIAEGFRDDHWWKYNPAALERRNQHSELPEKAFGGEPDHPRVNVGWYEAVAFCLWLSERSGQRIMLPTEQEWQWAAEGADGRTYAWGNEEPDDQLANWKKFVGWTTTPVNSYPIQAEHSPFGLYNMSGNVGEWCLTDYECGLQEIKNNTEYPVLRGGSWVDNQPLRLRVANRSGVDPRWRSSGVGFRVSRSL